mmetsp:Transcript_33990/g.56251  ORF Transcript_33990/g.56251 Transcript_33990/m.56251 type:complete len:490 (-) Transcript_33990:227-1696(-)
MEDRAHSDPGMQLLSVTVPAECSSGETFHADTPSGVMAVQVPQGVTGGQVIQIWVSHSASPTPSETERQQLLRQQEPPTAPGHAFTAPVLHAVDPDDPPLVMGTPVEDFMPKLASPGDDKFSGFQGHMDPQDAGGEAEAAKLSPNSGFAEASAIGTGAYFSAGEMQVLMGQPVPATPFEQHVRSRHDPSRAPAGEVVYTAVPVATSATSAVTTPIMTTGVGMPVLNTARAISGAKTQYDGWSGIKSCDERLQGGPAGMDELTLFFNTHNTRPLVGVQCHGWHKERRTRQVTHTDKEGRMHRRTEEYLVTVTDFDYKIDLTAFVFPFGFIDSVDERGLSPTELMGKYLSDVNLLKSLELRKEVQFDYEALRRQVHGYLRYLGWRRGLTISFPKANYTIRVYQHNWLSQMWENCLCNMLCHLTLVPCILMRVYRGDCNCSGHSEHAESDLRSYFRINYHVLQVFEAIRPSLWVPGWSGAAMAMEMVRNVFW